VAGLAASPAIGAEMPVKALAPIVAPWNWTGFYIGGHIGGALGNADIVDPFGTAVFGDTVRSPAFIAGGQIGANYQTGKMVVGAVADVSWAQSSGDNTCFGISGGTFFASNCSVSPDLFATFTGRVGYAIDRSLFYIKGGAAWEHNNVGMILNSNPGEHVLTSASSYGAWGWTAGGGVEYAMSPAWSLSVEYDHLGFASQNVATPYVPGNPLPLQPVAPLVGLSHNVEEAKLGLNYKLGADPTLWPAAMPSSSRMVVKAPIAAASSGWELEAGARAMYSWGRDQWDLGHDVTLPSNLLVSRLTWNNLLTSSAELYGRVDTPLNVFVSGFIGTGQTASGDQNDEDFHLVNPPPARPYNNTYSTNDGHIGYAVADLGYDVVRRPDYKFGPFVGYTYFNEGIFKYGCQQVANPAGNCSAAGMSPPIPSSQLIGLEDMTWQAVRVGLSGQIRLIDRVKLTADVAYLPYVTFNWLDDHTGRDLEVQMAGHGLGVQTQALLSYDLTDRLNIGIGGRYWAMWSNSASAQFIPGGVQPNRNAIELAGVFVQTGYRFVPGGVAAPRPGTSAAGLMVKAPVAVPAHDWTGFYVGAEGGGVWGNSKHIGQTGARDTFDATPWFDVTGGLAGGTAGYNAQFDRIWAFGLEGDASWSDAHGQAQQIPPFSAKQAGSTTERWLDTARVRLGFTPADRWLLYATGGLAAADVEAAITPSTFGSESHVRWGWTAGGGVEAMIAGNWSAKLEYLYVGLENHPYFVPTPNIPNQTNRAGGVPLDNQIVRAGLNYRLDWPGP
jgi:opacity protein-like surface antigen